MIVSAFPGCGKTYLYENQDKSLFNPNGRDIHFSFLDSDSSKFEKYEGWENEYVDYICTNVGKYDFIFIAQHQEVLKELSNRCIPFVMVAPYNGCFSADKEEAMFIKQQWFGRFVLRDNSHIKDINAWFKLLIDNYDEWVSWEHLDRYKPKTIIQLKINQYLKDVIRDLYRMLYSYSEYDASLCVKRN